MKFTNIYNIPRSMEDVIMRHTYDITESDPKRVGVTTLINPPRVRLLSVKHWEEIEEDVSDHLWKILGNACHYVLGKADSNTRIIEEKMTEEVDGITVVSKPDIYDTALHSLEDYKITSIWSAKLGDRDSWDNQLNCYAWFLRKRDYKVDNLYINAILKDWRRGEKLKYNDYPPIPFIRIKCNLWTFEEQEAYIKERVAVYKKCLELSEDLIPICSEKERWKKEDKFAVKKNSNKKAERVLDTAQEAESWIKERQKKDTKNKYSIEYREGADFKCTDYCSVNKFCSYYKEKYGDKNESKKS